MRGFRQEKWQPLITVFQSYLWLLCGEGPEGGGGTKEGGEQQGYLSCTERSKAA